MTGGAGAHGHTPRARRLLVDGVAAPDAGDDALRALLADRSAGCFWLDLPAGDPSNRELLADVFGIHPLAVDDADAFGQRPKAEDFDGYLYMVLFGAAAGEGAGGLAEVHIFYSERYLITIHRDDTAALDEARRHLPAHGPEGLHGPRLLYRVLDALADSFFPLLEDIDDEIVELENALTAGSVDEGLHGRIFALRRRLVGIRRVAAPARDQVARLASGSLPVAGVTEEGLRYLRDVEGHLIRITDTVDGFRDLLAGLTDVHLTTVSHRLNLVMKQLAIITVIFLPLTFLTGFFGQNFAWLVDVVRGPGHFLLLGLALPVAAVVVLLVWFRRRRWL